MMSDKWQCEWCHEWINGGYVHAPTCQCPSHYCDACIGSASSDARYLAGVGYRVDGLPGPCHSCLDSIYARVNVGLHSDERLTRRRLEALRRGAAPNPPLPPPSTRGMCIDWAPDTHVYPTPEQLGALQQTEDELSEAERKKNYLLLTSYAVDLGAEELRVLARVAERLAMGREKYGPLDAEDGRDWREEAAQEALDMAVYLSLRLA